MIDPACNPGTRRRAPGSEPSVEIDIQRIMQMIPHRQPFLMIDKVVDVVANARATGIKNITINEPYFQGHFPARPVMPGVLIIEAMAQTAAVLVVAHARAASRGQTRLFHDRRQRALSPPGIPRGCSACSRRQAAQPRQCLEIRGPRRGAAVG